MPLGPAGQLAHGGHLLQYSLPAVAQLRVQRSRKHPGEPIGQAAVSAACRVTVVENHQQVSGQRAGMIEGLKRHARGQGAVRDDCHDVSRLTETSRRNCNCERGANRSAAMCPTQDFVAVREPRCWLRAARLSVPATTPAAQQRVGQSLIATVPHDAVGRRVEHVMHGDCQFNRGQPRGEPIRRSCDVVTQQGAHFGGEGRELRNLQASQVRGQLE